MEHPEVGESESFGGWIYRRRRALNLTREELAAKVGCAAVTIKKIERDERKPSRQIAELLAENLMVPLRDRDRFMRMARETYADGMQSIGERLAIPAFLQQEDRNPYVPGSSFVGRQKELSRLEAHLQKALAGNAVPVFLLGDAGSGATRRPAPATRFVRFETSWEYSPAILRSIGRLACSTGPRPCRYGPQFLMW
jgi:transcriptional regulator with XRE-family HTH domain